MSAPFAVSHFSRQPYRDLHPHFLGALEHFTAWPPPEQYDELALRVPRAADVQLPRFVSENRAAVRQMGGYEQHVAELHAVPTRPENCHDFFNMTVWAHFPKSRWALNALHIDPHAGPKDPRNGRAPAQNVAATFDEAGMIVVSSSRVMLETLRALHFKQAFWEERAALQATTRFWVVGHGLLESLLTPHSALAARSLLIHVPALPARATAKQSDELRFEIDAIAATRIHGWRSARTVLDPIPVLAIPGFSDNDCAGFYEDMQNVRFEPISRRPSDVVDFSAG